MRSPLIAAGELSRLERPVILDARGGAGAREAFAAAHLPGARWVDLETELSALPADPRDGGRHPLPSIADWCARVGQWGIGPETDVVVYDALGGGNAAARLWWMLRAIGHERVFVVDGGWDAISCSGVTGASPGGRGPYPASVTEWPVVDASFVDRIRNDPAWSLIDARAPERHRGETEPIDPVAGHIPGATNFYWQRQLEPNKRFRPIAEVARDLDAVLGETSPDHVVCYCGSGVTACHVLLGLEAAGKPGGRLYVGSWSEWCRQDRPRESTSETS